MAFEIVVRIESPQIVTALLALVDVYGEMAKRLGAPGQPAQTLDTLPAAAEVAAAAEPTPSTASALQTESSKATAPTVSLEQVRAKMAALAQAGHREKAKQLLSDRNAKTLSEIPPEKYPELLAAIEAIK